MKMLPDVKFDQMIFESWWLYDGSNQHNQYLDNLARLTIKKRNNYSFSSDHWVNIRAFIRRI